MKHYDVVVVGCGAAGSSLTYHLASRGARTLTLEKFELNHSRGSSHGKTRIIRTAYFEDPRYVPLLRRAFESWEELRLRTGKRIIHLTGGLMIGTRDSKLVRGVLKSASEHKLEHELLTAREAMERFEMFKLDEGQCAVYERDAGVLFAEECVGAFAECATEEGAELRFNESVLEWKETKDGVEVRTSEETISADRLAFAAGPWNVRFLGSVIPLACERQVPCWFGPKGREFGPDRMPVFISEEKDRFFYGVPDFGGGTKAAETHRGSRIDPDEPPSNVTEEDKEPAMDFVRKRLPGLDPNPIEAETCIYTNTPDGNFVLDFYPGKERVLMVSACSGHGFKFASVLGEIGADLLLEGRTKYDISFLRAGRFAAGGGS